MYGVVPPNDPNVWQIYHALVYGGLSPHVCSLRGAAWLPRMFEEHPLPQKNGQGLLSFIGESTSIFS